MYLEVLKQEKRHGLHFLRLKDRKKGMTKAFGSYKVTSKLCVVYLELKLEQDTCGRYIDKLKCHKTVETRYSEVEIHKLRSG